MHDKNVSCQDVQAGADWGFPQLCIVQVQEVVSQGHERRALLRLAGDKTSHVGRLHSRASPWKVFVFCLLFSTTKVESTSARLTRSMLEIRLKKSPFSLFVCFLKCIHCRVGSDHQNQCVLTMAEDISQYAFGSSPYISTN